MPGIDGNPFRLLRPALRAHRSRFVVAVVASAVAQSAGIPLAMLTRRLVNLASDSAAEGTQRAFLIGGVLLLLLAVVRGAAQGLSAFLGESVAQGVVGELRVQMLSHLQRISLGYFDRRATGKVLVRFVGDAGSVRTWVGRTLVSIFADAVTLVAVVVALLTMSPILAVCAAAPIVPLVPAFLWINPRARALTREGRTAQARLSGILTDLISHMAAIKAVRGERTFHEPAEEHVEQIRSAFVRRGRLDAVGRAIAATAGSIAICLVGIAGSVMVFRGEARVGDIVAAVWLTLLLRGPVNRLTRANIARQRARVALDRVAALLRRKPERSERAGSVPFDGSGMRVRLSRLGYRFPNGKWAFRKMSATLNGPGLIVLHGREQVITVLFELILRLRRAHEGRIALDRQNVQKIAVDDLRASIGWIDAKRHVLDATIAVEGSEFRERALELLLRILSTERGRTIVRRRVAPAREEHSDTDGAQIWCAMACALRQDPRIVLVESPTRGLPEAEAADVIHFLEELSQERLVLIGDCGAYSAASRAQRIELPAYEVSSDP